MKKKPTKTQSPSRGSAPRKDRKSPSARSQTAVRKPVRAAGKKSGPTPSRQPAARKAFTERTPGQRPVPAAKPKRPVAAPSRAAKTRGRPKTSAPAPVTAPQEEQALLSPTASKEGLPFEESVVETAASEAVRPAPEPDSVSSSPTLPNKAASSSEDSEKALIKFDPLQRYLSEISKYRLLTREEERELGIRVKEYADKEAAYALVTANLRLVVKIALEFQRVWMQNLLDLIQEGNIGLMQAVKKFDPYKNVKFSYYASFWIKAYILKFIMDNWRLVKIGTTQGQRKLFFKLKKEKHRLIEQGFDPKPKLLSERLGVSEREVVDMDQRLDGWDVSLDAPVKNDSDTERIEFVSTQTESVEEQVSKKEIELLLHNKINEFRKRMTPREIEIFELRIFSDNPVTLQEIGDRYGISRERVRQIEKNIIRKMREFFKNELPDFASYSEDSGTE